MKVKAGYVVDLDEWKERNKKGENYWWIYIEEILNHIGLIAERIHTKDLIRGIKEYAVLFIGQTEKELPWREIEKWVESGGILIGVCLDRDSIFGNEFVKSISDKGVFSITGEIFLNKHFFTENIHSPIHKDKPLLVSGNIRLLQTLNSEVLAQCNGYPVITCRRAGKGWFFYFGFDLTKTFWILNQGRPVEQDYDGDGYLRNADGILINGYEPEILYTDEFLFLLQNMVSVSSIPLIHYLPSMKDGDIPDALFYYGGDDEATPGINIPASEFMKEMGLPYHINIMPDENYKFAVNKKEKEILEENGTEISLHLNFMDNFSHPSGFSESDVAKQVKLFIDEFKKIPVCCNTHWLRWTGLYEPALWMGQRGIKSFNGKIQVTVPPINPINRLGFSFGTSFPFFYWTDYKYENQKLDFLDLPIIAYECGYKYIDTANSSGWEDMDWSYKYEVDFPVLEKCINIATYYNLTMNFFYHPVYIARVSSCREIIKKIKEVGKEKELKIIHSTPDRLTEWWLARAKARIDDIEIEKNKIVFNTYSDVAIIVKIPLHNRKVNKINFPFRIKKLFSQFWIFISVPKGENTIEVVLQNP
ncbi:MAG: hypothetical protein N3D17_04960 [bacterium]|nr:hypothetical protein [bacterium]